VVRDSLVAAWSQAEDRLSAAVTQVAKDRRLPQQCYRVHRDDRGEPALPGRRTPVTLALGSGIHGAAVSSFAASARAHRPRPRRSRRSSRRSGRSRTRTSRSDAASMHTKENLLTSAGGCSPCSAGASRRGPILTVEQPFTVPLIDQETGEVLDRDPRGTLVIVHLRTRRGSTPASRSTFRYSCRSIVTRRRCWGSPTMAACGCGSRC
jgi:hypothetical protein